MKFFVFIFFLFLHSFALATLMSEERSKCYGMEATVQSYEAWKSDLHRFTNDYDSLKPDFRSTVLQKATLEILNLMKDLNLKAGLNAWTDLTKKSQALLDAVKSGDRPAASANRELKTNVVELEDAMADLILQAQKKTKCTLESPEPAVVKKASNHT